MNFEISGLNAGYGHTRVLQNIQIEPAKTAQLIGLIGPNASGKSTLFKSITGLIRPTSGKIELNGIDLVNATRAHRSNLVSYMPQSFGCNAALSVFESVLLALKQNSGWRVKPQDLSQVEETLNLLNLASIANRGLSSLSGGQAQMVSVAQTLVRDPQLILLDEPTSALDLHHQLSILSAIRQAMQKRKIIIIAALHDLNLAVQFCDRIILIRRGAICADGKPEDVLAQKEIDETYRVTTTLEHTSRDTLYVDAFLNPEPQA